MRMKLDIAGAIVVGVGLIAVLCVSRVREEQRMSGVLRRCYLNLCALRQAKALWMDENAKGATNVVGWDDLNEYLQAGLGLHRMTNGRPICPDGGTYKLGRLDEPPTCSIGGPNHSLPRHGR